MRLRCVSVAHDIVSDTLTDYHAAKDTWRFASITAILRKINYA
jgi:hypothetical protein